jgi:hypothetical protein
MVQVYSAYEATAQISEILRVDPGPVISYDWFPTVSYACQLDLTRRIRVLGVAQRV